MRQAGFAFLLTFAVTAFAAYGAAPVAPAAPAVSAEAAKTKTAAAASEPTAEEIAIASIRDRLRRASTSAEQSRLAGDLLKALDRFGHGRDREALTLVDRLLQDRPDDAALLWRRCDGRRRYNDLDGAIADAEKLAADHGGEEFGVRARRALPMLYLRTGRREQSALADEALLRDGLADPAAVLVRLVRTYALLDDPPRLKDSVERLGRVWPERVQYDPDLAWLRADSAAKVDAPEAGAAALLRFANLYPRDLRRGEALVRAAKIYQDLDNRPLALALMEEASRDARTVGVAVASGLGRAEMLDSLGQATGAREQYEQVLADAPDAETAGRALEKMVDVTRRIEGPVGALVLLASKINSGSKYGGEPGRRLFLQIAGEMRGQLAADAVTAAFVHALAREAHCEASLPAEVVLSAASLREAVGEQDMAATMYKPLAVLPGENGEAARHGLARSRPRELPPGVDPADPLRLEALEREQAWPLVLKAITGALDGKDAARARTLGARAAFLVNDPTWARELLEKLSSPSPEAALMRGDARALAGEWPTACRDYRAAEGPELGEAAAGWLQVRLAACETREGKDDDARARLNALLERKPGEPAAVAAERLLAQLPAADRGRASGKRNG